MNPSFESFWSAWPRSPRKEAKSKCLERWEKLKLDFQATQIIRHVTWLKTTDQWLKNGGSFIPAPLVYLNQMRWDGAEIPDDFDKPKQEKDPVLTKLEQDRANAVPMPDEIRQKIAQIRAGLQNPQ